MSCKPGCFEATIESCTDNIIVKAGLAADTEYFWLAEFKGTIYQRKVTTDGVGFLYIDPAALPTGLNQFSPAFNLSIRLGSNYLTTVMMQFGEDEYDCILVKFMPYDRDEADGSLVNVIQFDGSSTTGPVANPYVFSFVSADFTDPDDNNVADPSHVNKPAIIGKELLIFWNNSNRYLNDDEWTATATGINITADGFDAIVVPDTKIIVYIQNP